MTPMNTSVMDKSRPVLDAARQRVAAASNYLRANVRASPWATLGIVIAAGVLLGFLAYRSRR
jgi:ElaB/YqjD/DUF883 family membrane-anchored ribosome-binding protein